MNLLEIHTKPLTISTEKNNKKNSFKEDRKQSYQDPLKKWPLKGLSYSNEIGAVVGELSPKLGIAFWVPALMYFGADIYDKYKNDETQYSPSKRRGAKEALFQAMAGVIMPTVAVGIGHKATSNLNRITRTGLSTKTKQTVLEKSMAYMQSKSLHNYENNHNAYKEGFKRAIITISQDAKGDFKALPTSKKILKAINPLKSFESIAFANEDKLGKFAEKQAENILKMRETLMRNERPKNLSKKLFEKFQSIQTEYQKIYTADKYMGKAAKSILNEYHKSQILKNKMITTIGGFVALALLAEPIDKFVDKIIIKRLVEPCFDITSKIINKNNKSK